jgi:hypothetical protein
MGAILSARGLLEQDPFSDDPWTHPSDAWTEFMHAVAGEVPRPPSGSRRSRRLNPNREVGLIDALDRLLGAKTHSHPGVCTFCDADESRGFHLFAGDDVSICGLCAGSGLRVMAGGLSR